MKNHPMRNLVLLGTLTLGTARAQPRQSLGVGVIVGEPTGLSLKHWTGRDTAVDAGIAWSFAENDSLHFHADYLVHRFDLLRSAESKGQSAVYYGLGGRIKLRENEGRGRNNKDDLFGIRVPFGISHLPQGTALELFVEIVPILDVVPKSDLGVNAALGARYYF